MEITKVSFHTDKVLTILLGSQVELVSFGRTYLTVDVIGDYHRDLILNSLSNYYNIEEDITCEAVIDCYETIVRDKTLHVFRNKQEYIQFNYNL